MTISMNGRSLHIWASIGLAAGLLIASLVLMGHAALAEPAVGSIRGTLTYNDDVYGQHTVYYAVFTHAHTPPPGPVVVGSRIGPGPYNVTKTLSAEDLPNGTYYMTAMVDINDSGPNPGPEDLMATYDPEGDGTPNPIVVDDGAVTGVDIYLGGPWTPVGGPSLEGGRASALEIHPTISGSVYAAVYLPGPNGEWYVPSTVYKSTDGAGNWATMQTVPHRLTALAVTDTVVYAGGYNRAEMNPYPILYYGTDDSSPWTVGLSLTNGAIYDISIHPALTTTAIAGGGDFPDNAVVYHTSDGGATWTEVFSYTSPDHYPTVNQVIIHPTSPMTWLLTHDGMVGGTFGAYIHRSTDGGVNWTEVYSVSDQIISNMVVNPYTPTIVYATAGASSGPDTYGGNLYRSLDAGATWTAVITDGSAGQELAVAGPNTMYAAGGCETFFGSGCYQIYKSTDGGDAGTWAAVASPGDAVALLASDRSAGALYAGGEMHGLFKSDDGAASWEQRNTGIDTPVYPAQIEPDPQNQDKLFVAAGSEGGWMTADGGDTWTRVSGAHTAAFAVNPANSDIVYGGEHNDQHGAIIRSEDGGLNFTPVYTASFLQPDGSGGCEGIQALVVAPSMTRTVYAGGFDSPSGGGEHAVVVRTRDDGASWTEVFTLPSGSSVEALAVDPTDADTVYAGGWDSSADPGFVYRTSNGGEDWDLVKAVSQTVKAIVVDPQKPHVVYASDGGYHVHKSTDSGDTWTTVRRPPWEPGGGVSGDLLNLDPNVPSHLYLGGFGYVGESYDGGHTWSDMGAETNRNTPGGQPLAMAVDHGAVTQTLYAGFHSGLWHYRRAAPQPGQPATVTASSGVASARAGETVAVRSLVVDDYVNWVADGTSVVFATSPEGSFASSAVTKTTRDGWAEAALTGVTSGTASITVTSGSAMDTLTVTFTPFQIYLPLVIRGG